MSTRQYFLSLVIAALLWTAALYATASVALAAEPVTMVASYYGIDTCAPGPTCITSSGRLYDYRDPHTAAHRWLPFGTRLYVCTVDGTRCLHTVIYDRGPFVANRDLDLSQAGYATLAPLSTGVMRVRVLRIYGGDPHVRALFRAHYGEQAAGRWLAEHLEYAQ